MIIDRYSDKDWLAYSDRVYRLLREVRPGYLLVENRRSGRVYRSILRGSTWLIYPKESKKSTEDIKQDNRF